MTKKEALNLLYKFTKGQPETAEQKALEIAVAALEREVYGVPNVQTNLGEPSTF